MTTTMIEYSREIGPKIRKLLELNTTLKEWKAEDELAQEYLAEIKALNETLKAHIEDKESTLVREIKALSTDIGLACKAAAKGTEYSAQELKAYFTKRAQEKVQEVVEKGILFDALDKVLA